MTNPLLEWSGDFVLGDAMMDNTHREFVDMLNRIGAAADGDLLGALDDFIVHTEAHFGQEDRWMQATAFPPQHCHQGEHAYVMETMREVRQRVANGQVHLAVVLAKAIAEWFPRHAATMDAMLAAFMKQTGYAPSLQTAATTIKAARVGCAGLAKKT